MSTSDAQVGCTRLVVHKMSARVGCMRVEVHEMGARVQVMQEIGGA